MAFFLIGRGPDDDLRLISPKSFESRQVAMAELSRLSAEPSFEHWDAEVSVMDLDTGVPVLLVRSGVAAAPGVEPASGPVDAADAWEADLPQAQAEEPALVTSPAFVEASEASAKPIEEPLPVPSEPQPAPIAEPVAENVPEAIEAPFWELPTVALIEPVADEAIADAIVAEAPASAAKPDIEAEAVAAEPAVLGEMTPEPEAAHDAEALPEPVADLGVESQAPEETPAPAPLVDENDELRAAILRTTEHMSAEGIVAPESVGLAPAEPQVEAEPAPVESLEAEPSAPESAVQAAAPDIEAEIAQVADASPAPPKAGFWPWARAANSADAEGAGVAPEVAGVYDALQEPATELPEPDVEAALRHSILLPTDGVADSDDHDADPHLPMSSLSPQTDAHAPAPSGEAVDSSDFILDLDEVEPTPVETPGAGSQPTPAAPMASDAWSFGGPETVTTTEPLADQPSPDDAVEPVAAVSPLQDYTCEDCVYVTTCPNRDQRLPKDCGSFQWR